MNKLEKKFRKKFEFQLSKYNLSDYSDLRNNFIKLNVDWIKDQIKEYVNKIDLKTKNNDCCLICVYRKIVESCRENEIAMRYPETHKCTRFLTNYSGILEQKKKEILKELED